MAKERLEDEYPVSDKEMVQKAIKQHEEKEVRDYKFPTEIIDLPSKGLIYEKDNPLSSGKIEMKYMTAKEEDILTNQSFIKAGVVLDKLFQSLIVTPINYNDLLLGDKNAIMIAARVLGYGKDYEITVTDDEGNEQKQTIDLTQLEDKEIDCSIYDKEDAFDFELPVSKRTVKVHLITQRIQKKINDLNRRLGR